MGLDTFAHKDGSLAETLDWPKESEGLCGGMFSGNGGGPSFRGKVYDQFIQDVTGVSLYQKHMPNREVREVADGIRDWLEESIGTRSFNSPEFRVTVKLSPKIELDEWDITIDEALALYHWFQFAAEQGCTVCGWW